ncbi:hypothetical protein IM660_04205 [Ruania alkalisoli]|uniref:Actinobacteria/chloroflexi VLRF1 release factor domain-containing protein n=1 Tax=Ruania alkalisoli TaxID=2779775 RepID=A0A7M1SVK3_9MICO|nr:acVLRF1 family peptidyl-tRNA hydrolase [Ruania alkalisoli]QOR71501.1 hypothetical protein IM660_04205 [Ruania alkalisoli]
MSRRLEIGAARLPGWMARFAARHPGATAQVTADGVRLDTPDGAWAEVTAWPGIRPEPSPTGLIGWDSLADWAAGPPACAFVLIRRGGWAVGLSQGDRLVRHRTGRRYVQSRTAAGGWSQQRFARRRGNQADALVVHVAGVVEELVGQWRDDPGQGDVSSGGLALNGLVLGGLVLGGDKALASAVLAELPGAGAGPGNSRAGSSRAGSPATLMADLPRRELYDLPDPRLVVLRSALTRARSAVVTIDDPALR